MKILMVCLPMDLLMILKCLNTNSFIAKPITLKNNWDLEENIVVSRETKSLPKIPDSPNKAVEQNTIKKGTNNPSSLIRE
ncbi:MAG: hypothetical protein IPI52_06170 [Bacteroidetes bacterium]|nr:hypothetical protein [Bacteroidota bacterium]